MSGNATFTKIGSRLQLAIRGGCSDSAPREQQLTRPNPLTQHVILACVAASTYTGMFFLNSWMFSAFEFATGVNWLYLPAGVRLLLVLMFGLSGAVGISVASASLSIAFYAPDDPVTGLVAGVITGFAPYLVQQLLPRFASLHSSLVNINAASLLQLALLYAVATSFAHQVWYLTRGITDNFWLSVWPMFVGDLAGTLLVLYTAHAAVKLLRRRLTKRLVD